MTDLSKEQLLKELAFEKLAFSYQAGQLLGWPLKMGLGVTKNVLSPVLKAGGGVVKGLGKGVGKLGDYVLTPAALGTGALVLKGATSAAKAGAGFTQQVGKGVAKNVAAPMAKTYTNYLAKNPVTGTLGTAGMAFGLHDIYKRNAGRGFSTGSGSPLMQNYQNMKTRFTKAGSDMTEEQQQKIEKVANILSAAKQAVGYGGPQNKSILGALGLGMAGLAASPVLGPSLSSLGDALNRKLYPLDDRINAEEEMAKKQLGILAAHQMDKMLGQQDAMGRSFQDMPKVESNLEYAVQNDPIVSDIVNQDPSKVDEMRETLQTVYEFAPDIAVNRQAAQSILRESAMSPDGGLNYNTIKLIADTQKSISGGR